MQNKKDNSHVAKMVAVGATLASIAAGAYFFLGPEGKKHQKNTKAWAIKMKADVIEKLESAKDVSESTYHTIIDSVAAKYAKGKKISNDEIELLAEDLKKHWNIISKSVGSKK